MSILSKRVHGLLENSSERVLVAASRSSSGLVHLDSLLGPYCITYGRFGEGFGQMRQTGQIQREGTGDRRLSGLYFKPQLTVCPVWFHLD